MKRNLKKLVKGGIETIVLVVVMVAIVLGLFIAVVMPMVNSAEKTGQQATKNSESIFNQIDSMAGSSTN